ncbi:hypothetical protein [Streptomyces sp. NPDC093589]|uniref:hypothetical protein n=1 Tax=Streptomyces sp. NPDC093589 TaxID=3366043 RepID=UPI00380A34DF
MTRSTLPTGLVQAPAALAAHLSTHGMPGQRSATAITLLRRKRARRTRPASEPAPLAERARARRHAAVIREIRRRGGETAIEGRYGVVHLDLVDRSGGMALAHAEGWRAYGKFPARMARLSYLWGPDDAGSGPWAVRVPGTVTTVDDALEWLTPAEVTQALARGRRVRRQGDVYAVETTWAHDGTGAGLLASSHQWRPDTRFLVHRPDDGRRHRPVRLPWPVRFVQQTAYGMGRSNGRANAD